MTARPIKIANAQAFWGDSPDAAATLARQQPDLDFITLDYLAEVSMSILAMQRDKSGAGYARDFVEVIKSLVPAWQSGSGFKVVTNAGGLDPAACGVACQNALRGAGIEKRIAIVSGDDVLQQLQASNQEFSNLESSESLSTISDRLVTANAYLGAAPIAEALNRGADIVITGRVADPSMVVGCCMHGFDWSENQYQEIAGATIAGHLIECGTQATGGFSTDWLNVEHSDRIGFPIVEVGRDGSVVLTKPLNTGGVVSLMTTKEQLLYEIGNPGAYLSPDVTVDFRTIALKQVGADRVSVRSATGSAPTDSYKVSATYRDGFKAHGELTIFGRDAVAKARRCGEIVLKQVERVMGRTPKRSLIECLGAGASAPGIALPIDESAILETVLRVSVADDDRAICEAFSRRFMSLITAGPAGVTGYAGGRPRVQPVFGYWPCLIEKSRVSPRVEMIS